MKEDLNDIRLSAHFKLIEFLNQQKYADNIPTMQAVVNLTYGCHMLLFSRQNLDSLIKIVYFCRRYETVL